MRSTFSSLSLLLSTGLFLALASSSASADSIRIDFDLTGSSVSLLGGLLEIPPDGMLTSGSARVTVPGASATEPSAGAAELSGLQLAGTIDTTIGGSVAINGGFAADQTSGGGLGNLEGGLTTLSIASLPLNLNGNIDCVGGACVSIGDFPISIVDMLVLFISLDPFAVSGLDTPGAATLNGVLPFTLGGSDGVLTLVGQESARSFVPEPASGLLLGLGLVAALGVGPRRTAKR